MNEVRWAFRLSQWQCVTVEQIRRAFARIQPEEVDRLMKFMFLDDLKASLVGRLMIRNFVASAMQRKNASIHIARDERGKPYFENLSFNVSHQGNFSVLAGSTRTTGRLGVDVMKMEYTGGKSLQEFFRLMDRNFTDNEWKFIKGGRGHQDLIGRFMRVWCLKESYVKALGVGITVNLREIDLHIDSPITTKETIFSTKLRLLGREGPEEDWQFEETLLDAEHCVAVAVEKPGSTANTDKGFWLIENIDWLLDNIDPLRKEEDVEEELCYQVLKKETKK